MIIYRASKRVFINDCRDGIIGSAVKADFENHLGPANASEERSWERLILIIEE